MSKKSREDEKSRIEASALEAAKQIGFPVPAGKVRCLGPPAPDFVVETQTGTLGIELTELLRPANGRFLPVQEEQFHNDIVRIAQGQYYADSTVQPAQVVVYFAQEGTQRRNRQEIAQSLANFVQENVHRARPSIAFSERELPEEFVGLSIAAGRRDWWCGECGGPPPIPEMRQQLGRRIQEKNQHLPEYRTLLPTGAEVWLLVYTTFAVSRHMPIPCGVEDWRFPFDFEKVYWADLPERDLVEIHSTPAR